MKNVFKVLACLFIPMLVVSCEKDNRVARAIIINKITLTKFPPLAANGNEWDTVPFASGPDIYVQLYQQGKSIWESTVYQDALPGINYTFLTGGLRVTNLADECLIKLQDKDTFVSELMGGNGITLLAQGSVFPSVIKTSSCLLNCLVEFEFEVSYEF